MPRQNTPDQAVSRYRKPFEDAVRCLSHGTLIVRQKYRYQANSVDTLSLNENSPIPLRCSNGDPIGFSFAQTFQVVREEGLPQGPFRVHTLRYFYSIEFPLGVEVLAFHWDSNPPTNQMKSFPHLHVGQSMISPSAQFFPETFSNFHIPTGRVSIENVVRFLIEELGVTPNHRMWETKLTSGQRSFDAFRRRF